MKAKISPDGVLSILAENETEDFALHQWFERHNTKDDVVYRHAQCYAPEGQWYETETYGEHP